MAELLKHRYNSLLISSLADALQQAHKPFDINSFTDCVFDAKWEQKELKDRMKHVAVSINQCLDLDYLQAIEILKTASSNFNGFEFMFFPAYVELYGMDQFDTSISALEFFTQFSSSEFAVRPFIKQCPNKMMPQMLLWARSENHHVRRLASEGCRPRLPWAMALPEFKKDPSQVLAILELLKNDDSEYVQRSVANNLNDISKDNPQLLIDMAKSWMGNTSNTDALLKHACRGLLKSGNQTVLSLFGFKPANHVELSDFEVDREVAIGDSLQIEFCLSTADECLGKLRIEYAVSFLRSNGGSSNKVFKISEADFLQQIKRVTKRHSFKLISTRRYYSGPHTIDVIVNGEIKASAPFQLVNKKGG